MSMGSGDAVLAVWVALGGGAGAALRYMVDFAVTSRWRGRFPLGTFFVNVSGSLALGLVVGEVSSVASFPAALLGTGVLGGYTTFSTASYDTVRLARAGRGRMALVYAVGTMLTTVAAAIVGLWLTGSWSTVG